MEVSGTACRHLQGARSSRSPTCSNTNRGFAERGRRSATAVRGAPVMTGSQTSTLTGPERSTAARPWRCTSPARRRSRSRCGRFPQLTGERDPSGAAPPAQAAVGNDRAGSGRHCRSLINAVVKLLALAWGRRPEAFACEVWDPVAVGTALRLVGSGSPPRRSQRARLAHWAPASGSGVEAHVGPGMQDAVGG